MVRTHTFRNGDVTLTMPTFKTLLETANGLYREMARDRGYGRDELIGTLPDHLLERVIALDRVDRFTYQVRFTSEPEPAYVLYSRRRQARGEAS
jgi:hypothetical protein